MCMALDTSRDLLIVSSGPGSEDNHYLLNEVLLFPILCEILETSSLRDVTY